MVRIPFFVFLLLTLVQPIQLFNRPMLGRGEGGRGRRGEGKEGDQTAAAAYESVFFVLLVT